MGVDITMKLMNKHTGEILCDNLFGGRNTEWFDNICGRAYDNNDYDMLPCHAGVPANCPDSIDDLIECCYYSFNYINFKDYIDWYNMVNPNLYAGWVQKYDEWAYLRKHIRPNKDDVMKYLPEDANPALYVFCEFEYPSCDKEVIDKVVNILHKSGKSVNYSDYVIYYYFDC